MKNSNIFTFYSLEFNTTTENKEKYINDNNFGDDLIEWLAKEIERKLNIKSNIDSIAQEDFGWAFGFKRNKERYNVIIGIRENEKNEIQWVGWIEKRVGLFEYLKGMRKNQIENDILVEIHNILTNSGKVKELKWYYSDDFDKGIEENYIEQPK